MVQENIFNTLKTQIILLEHQPGKVLREKEIMEEFGVSRTPVREALIRLKMEGLVRIIPNVGTIVEDVSFQQLKDVFETRSYLIQLSGQLAATRITKEELKEIRQRIDAMRSTEDNKTLMQLDDAIHKIINRATKNEVLVKMLESLHDQMVRIWIFSGVKGNYWKGLEREFTDIADSLEQHDATLASRLLDEHTKRFVEHVRSQLTF